jgi:PAS domain S-box-containing protein
LRIATAGVFVVTLAGAAVLCHLIDRLCESHAQAAAENAARDAGDRIRLRLDRALSASYAVAAIVRQNNGNLEHFESLGHELLKQYNELDEIAVGPNGIYSAVVPLKGNEAVIGFNPFADKAQQSEARLARDSRLLTVAGPMPLVQGGNGIVGRIPVFLPSAAQGERYWGIVTVAVRTPRLVRSGELSRLSNAGYTYELWRNQSAGNRRHIVSSTSPSSLRHPVSYTFNIANSQWTLEVAPAAGWRPASRTSIGYMLALLFASGAAGLCYSLLRPSAAGDGVRSGLALSRADGVAGRASLFDDTSASLCILRDGVLVLANRRFEEMLGFDVNALSGRSLLGLFASSAQYERCREQIALAQRQAGALADDFEIIRKNGERIWLRFNVAAVDRKDAAGAVALAALDVTARHQAQEQALSSASRFLSVFEAAPCAMIITRMDGHIVEANRRWLDISGFETAELAGRTTLDLGIWNSAAARELFVAEILRNGKVVDFEATFRNKRGVTFTGLISATRFPIDGEACILSTVIDVSELHRELQRIRGELARVNTRFDDIVRERTAAIADANALLRESNRELEAFSYRVSHDLNGPVHRIEGFGSLILSEHSHALSGQVRDYLSRILVNANRMRELLRGLFELSHVRRHAIIRSRIDLSALAREITEQLGAAAPARVAEFVIEEGMVAEGDQRMLRVVMENLLANAWKYTAQRAITRIEVRRAPPAAGEPVFFVRDNGAGFDMAHVAKLFQPFERLHHASEFHGHGIGLATVQRAIARHGGAIWAESAAGEGASFFFTLNVTGCESGDLLPGAPGDLDRAAVV